MGWRNLMGDARPDSIPRHISPYRTIYFHSVRRFGVVRLRPEIGQRSVLLANYIIEHNATVRAAAARFGVSKSTVHAEVTI